jgi:chromosome segregation ATPase
MNDEMLHGIDDYNRGYAVQVGRLKEELKKAHQENKSLRERVADSEDYNATLNRSLGTQKDALDCGLRKIEKMRGVIDDKNEQIQELNKEADQNLAELETEKMRSVNSEQFIKEVRCDHKSEIEVYKDQIARLTTDNDDLKTEVEDTTERYCSDILELRREIKALSVLLKLKL